LNDSITTNTTGAGTPSDEELAGRVRRGCVKSYEELDRRFRARLVFLLRKRTGSREDAEDLTQQALLRAYERIDQFDPKRSFRSWLFTIAVRLAIDAYRKRRVDATGQGIEWATDPGPGPAETVSQRDTQRRLWALADRVLDPTQRTALWLHYGEQLKAKEIAKALGINAVHARVLLYRARRKLMTHLDETETKRPVGVVPEPVCVPMKKRSTVHREPSFSEGAVR
jgi:RNA polymerase sigma-70 factor, ECF subfamily